MILSSLTVDARLSAGGIDSDAVTLSNLEWPCSKGKVISEMVLITTIHVQYKSRLSS